MESAQLLELARRHGMPGEELKRAIRRWQQDGGSLALRLLEGEVVEDLALADGLARMLSLPRVSAAMVRNLDRELFASHPLNFWLESSALPFRRPQDGSLLIGLVDPSAEQALPKLRAHLSAVWKPSVLSALHFSECLESQGASGWRLQAPFLRELRKRFSEEKRAPSELAVLLGILLQLRVVAKAESSSGSQIAPGKMTSQRPRRDTANIVGVVGDSSDRAAVVDRSGRTVSSSGKMRGLSSDSHAGSSGADPHKTTAVSRDSSKPRPIVMSSDAHRVIRFFTPGRTSTPAGGHLQAITREPIVFRAIPTLSLAALLRSAFPLRLADREAVEQVRSLILPALRHSQTIEDATQELIEHLELLFPRVILFGVRNNTLSVRAVNQGRLRTNLKLGQEFTLTPDSDWVRALEDGRALAGSLPAGDPVASQIGAAVDEPIVAVPIELGGRSLFMVLVSRGTSEAWPDAGDLLVRSAAAMAQALARIAKGLREQR